MANKASKAFKTQSNSHLDSRGFKKRFAVPQRKIVFNHSAPLLSGKPSAITKKLAGGKGSGGQSRDSKGRFD